MNLITLIAYALVNMIMVLSCLSRKKGSIYEFPLWMGAIGLGWFFPMARIQVAHGEYPENAYAAGMLFATVCTIAVWAGFTNAYRRESEKRSWLKASFDREKLISAGALLCAMGFFFYWKLMSLPEEMLLQTQWSGATVKYLFLSSVFKMGFLALWLVYLDQKKWMAPKILIFVVPSLLVLLDTAFVKGRRAGMMDLAAYILISVWFTRRVALPRWALLTGVTAGFLLIGSIGIYRTIMSNDEWSLSERFRKVAETDFVDRISESEDSPQYDFDNYIYFRQVLADEGKFNFGLSHWNGLVWNYVPAQLVGSSVKRGLMIPELRLDDISRERYGHKFQTGTVATGYTDAFASFGWLGFIKFFWIGWMMGVLYRHAMSGYFLAQLLYILMLGTGMHSVSHGTQAILVSSWVYFFVLGYPVLYWAKLKTGIAQNSGVNSYIEDRIQ